MATTGGTAAALKLYVEVLVSGRDFASLKSSSSPSSSSSSGSGSGSVSSKPFSYKTMTSSTLGSSSRLAYIEVMELPLVIRLLRSVVEAACTVEEVACCDLKLNSVGSSSLSQGMGSRVKFVTTLLLLLSKVRP